MAKKKVKLTRPELRRQRDAMDRFERYLPTLQLKQQQLQVTVREVAQQRERIEEELAHARRRFAGYRALLAGLSGINVEAQAEPAEVRTGTTNVAGVRVPQLQEVRFAKVTYSLFATPPWVDRALGDLREVNRLRAEVNVVREKYRLLYAELRKITQRVNLFEKVKIPEARENIRIIRIHLGDEMTAGVARAKIAKAKIAERESSLSASSAGAEKQKEATS